MILNKFTMGLLKSPADDFEAGGAAEFGAESFSDDTDDDYYEEEHEQTQQHQQQQEPQIPLSAMREFMTLQQQNLQQQQHQPLTQEQIDQQLKVYKADLKLAQRFFGEDATDDQVSLLNEMISGITTHISTLMGYSNQYLMDQLNQQYSPALEMVREQKVTGFVSGIEQAFPALKGQGRIIRQVIENLKAQGYSPADGNEAARVVAGQVEALIRTVNPQFSLSQRQRQQQGQPTTMPRMAGSNGGTGGGAAGAAGGGGKPKKAFNAIWD